ncbi:hypothetical protein F4778DRAFT_783490 [Xylariomycetidae sp. FL2044]|nr:hypothetical protein F4778DRAFT_783490 [Xylariomycetidae sp. FL2044]
MTIISARDDSFDDDFNNHRDGVDRAATAISIGWIVGIVIIILSAIGFGVAAIIVYRRSQRRRRERSHAQPPYNGDQTYQYGNQTEMGGWKPLATYGAPQPSSPPQYGAQYNAVDPHTSPSYNSSAPPVPGK